jgi:glycosyltransferase involved in cell wall biosynthesis
MAPDRTDTHPTRSIRVLQVVLSLNPGGTERLVVDLATRLHDEVPMAVCCLDEAGAWAPQVRARGIAVHALGRPAGFHPSLGGRIAALAHAHRANVIHAHHYSPFVYAALSRVWRPRTRIVFTEHGRLSDAGPSPKRRRVNRLVFSHAAHRVFAVSGDLRQHIVDEGFRTVDVIYNGITPGPLPTSDMRADIRARLDVDHDTLVVGTIARLDPVKDLGSLVAAIAHAAASRPVVLAIVGDGPERPALEAATKAHGLVDRVRFLGQRHDARDWLAGMDVYVNSSTSEGVSLTILEAMAAGLPVVVTAVGGTPEVVTPECGHLVAPRQPAAIAEALLAIGRNGPAATAMGRAGRARVENQFTLDRMIADYRSVYREVA